CAMWRPYTPENERHRRRVPRRMDDADWRGFISEGTPAGRLATAREDGRPRLMPVWFVLDGDDIVLSTGATSIKGRDLQRTGIASVRVDAAHPPFALVTGSVAISGDLGGLARWATVIARRYLGADRAEEFGRRNAASREVLVRPHAEHTSPRPTWPSGAGLTAVASAARSPARWVASSPRPRRIPRSAI